MGNFIQYLFANAYSSFSPALNTASTVCIVNGQPTNCGPVSAFFALGFGFFMLFYFVIIILIIVSMWKIYQKAGQPGWAAIVPIYNIVVMLHMVKKPVWWIILMFIPLVNIVIAIIIPYNLAKVFGKGGWFTFGLIILPFIFYPILAFGKSKYTLSFSPVDQGIGVPPTNSQTM